MTIKTTKFARKPFYVDAVQVTEENIEEVAKWCMADGVRTTEKPEGAAEERYIKVRVHRPLTERQTKAFVGDWVLYAGTGFKVYTPRAFEKSFERVTTLTKKQADEAGIHPPIEKKPPTPRVLDKARLESVSLDAEPGPGGGHIVSVGSSDDDLNEDELPIEEQQARFAARQADAEDVDYRDAVTGQYVSEEYAEQNPDTTVSESSDADRFLDEVADEDGTN